MKTSELFRKKILDTYVGSIVNTFRIKKRRNCLYFADIFIEYIKQCEENGFSNEMKDVGRKWMYLYFSQLAPPSMAKLPLPILSKMMKKIWINLGLMEDFRMSINNDTVYIKTKKEAITNRIGKNKFSLGLFEGICNAVLKSGVEVVQFSQSDTENTYLFKIKHGDNFKVASKEKSNYDNLNFSVKSTGFSLRDSFMQNMFQIRDNMIYFRKKQLYTVENTLFHLIGEKNIMQDRITKISFDFFADLVKKDSTNARKFGLIKTILQITGWGIVKIIVDDKKIKFIIKNPPIGLQKINDNWTFLANSLLGYIWIIDKSFAISKITEDKNVINIDFSKD